MLVSVSEMRKISFTVIPTEVLLASIPACLATSEGISTLILLIKVSSAKL